MSDPAPRHGARVVDDARAMVLAPPGAAAVMFARDRPRMDVVAVIMMVARPMTGAISMSEALVGCRTRISCGARPKMPGRRAVAKSDATADREI